MKRRRPSLAIVDQDGVGGAIAESEIAREHLLERQRIATDVIVGQQRAARVTKARIANTRRGPAHQHDGLMTRPLQPTQRHDGQEMPDMQAVGGGVEARIGRARTLNEGAVEPLEIGALVQEAAGGEHLKAGRLQRGHFGLPCARRPETKTKMPPDCGGIDRQSAMRSRPMMSGANKTRRCGDDRSCRLSRLL
jgi:hypothetical protein